MAAGKIKAKKEDLSHCICVNCQTYNECMREKGEILFCIIGRSPMCTFDKKVCACLLCPVKDNYRFSNLYYCILGTEQKQKTK
ncbi:MAG: DUF2769 domain-containing protein [Methanoregulaceae archaeon]